MSTDDSPRTTRDATPKRKGDGARAEFGFFAIIPEALLYGPVSDGAIRLWGVLHRHADRGGQSWPSRTLLAKLCHCSVSTVDRRVVELTESGWMTVERRYDEAGDPTSNLYILRLGGRAGEGTVSPGVGVPGGPTSDDLMRATDERETSNETGPSGPGADPDSGRGLSTEGARSVVLAGPDPAREIVDVVWRRRRAEGKPLPTVRHGSPYMALVQVTKKLLEAGHDRELVALTLFDHGSAWTNDALLVTLDKVQRGRASDPRLAAAMHDRAVADELRRLRERDEEVG